MDSGLLRQKMDLLEHLPVARGPETLGKGPKSVCGRKGCPEADAATLLGPGAAAASLETELQLQSQPCPFRGAGCGSATAAGAFARVARTGLCQGPAETH